MANEIKVVCAGTAIVGGGQGVKGYEFHILDEEGRLTDNTMYFKASLKSMRGVSVGQIYKTIRTETGIEGGLEWVGSWEDKEQINEWLIESKTNQNALDQNAKKKRMSEKDKEIFDERLSPIREMYHQTNAQGKAALIALVIQSIQRGI